MSKMEASYDYHRYKKLLAEAVDETKRLQLIDQLIQEKARDRLEAQRTSDRVASGNGLGNMRRRITCSGSRRSAGAWA